METIKVLTNLITQIFACAVFMGLAWIVTVKFIMPLLAFPALIGIRELGWMTNFKLLKINIPKNGYKRFFMNLAGMICTAGSFTFLADLLKSPLLFLSKFKDGLYPLSFQLTLAVTISMFAIIGISFFTKGDTNTSWVDRFDDIDPPKFWDKFFKI